MDKRGRYWGGVVFGAEIGRWQRTVASCIEGSTMFACIPEKEVHWLSATCACSLSKHLSCDRRSANSAFLVFGHVALDPLPKPCCRDLR